MPYFQIITIFIREFQFFKFSLYAKKNLILKNTIAQKSLLTIHLLGLCTFCVGAQLTFSPVDPKQITIARDSWGVPHIFATTDAEAAYGLAYANSEDAFAYMQETVIMGKGMSGRLHGKTGAAKDFLFELLEIKKLAEEKYDSLPVDFLKYLDGYCQGLNAYAKAHKKEILLKNVFPVTHKDILQSYAFTSCLISWVHFQVQKIMNGKFDAQEMNRGSNAFALRASRTTDGKTCLVINPHVPLDGQFSLYEAHVYSEEGMNFTGALQHGSIAPLLGNNEHLGWGMTYNLLDLVDTYQLKMHPKKKYLYEYDGDWLTLEKNPFWLKVKIGKFLNIPVRKVAYKSIHGAVLKSPGGRMYSLRMAGNMDIRMPQHFYELCKTKNLNEFKEVFRKQMLIRFNIVYADKEDNIFYLCNGIIPERDTSYNWEEAVPGNTSRTLWKKFIPMENLPQLENPGCGYVFNTNHCEFNTTCKENNIINDYERFPKHIGLRYGNNNRSTRFMELIDQKEKFSLDDIKAIKFDCSFPDSSYFLSTVNPFFNIDTARYPHLSAAASILKSWDKKAGPGSSGATMAALAMDYIFKKKKYWVEDFINGVHVNEALFAEALDTAQKHLLNYFGKLEVPLGDFQKLVRGDIEMPLPGYSDMLLANYIEPYKDGKYKGFVGDSYTHFVQFSKDGAENIETLVPFGSSAKPGSRHYTDQMQNFVEHKTKKMSLNKEEILKTAERIYHPE